MSYHGSSALPSGVLPGTLLRRRIIGAEFQRAAVSAERLLAVIALMVLTGGLVGLFTGEGRYTTDPVAGDPVRQAVYATTYALVLFAAFVHPRSFARTFLADRLLVVLVLLALASVLWSDAPDVTARRAVGVLGATVVGVWIAARWTFREQLRLIAVSLGAAAILSLLVVLLMPDRGVSSEFHEGAWRGIFTHKQTLGRYMALAVTVLALHAAGARRRVPAIVALCIAGGLVVMSTSRTAMVVTGALIAAIPLFLWLRARSPLLIVTLGIALLLTAVAALVAFEYRESLALAVGKDVTLTGRTALWGIVWSTLDERIWLGWGLGAFWLGWSGASAAVWDAVGWTPPHAHNGMLDLWLHLGAVGVATFIIGFTAAVVRAVRHLRRDHSAAGLWPLLFLVFFLLYNVPSRLILEANELTWTLYVAVLASLARGDA